MTSVKVILYMYVKYILGGSEFLMPEIFKEEGSQTITVALTYQTLYTEQLTTNLSKII